MTMRANTVRDDSLASIHRIVPLQRRQAPPSIRLYLDCDSGAEPTKLA